MSEVINNPVQQQRIRVERERRIAASRRNKLFFAAFIVFALVAPFGIYPVFLMKLLCFALFACAFNLLLGYAGLLSFGHAAFLATGGYITGFVLTEYSGLSTELGILTGTAASALLGLGFGLLAIRRQGIYFAMITLALAQLVFFMYMQSVSQAVRTAYKVYRGDIYWVLSIYPTTSICITLFLRFSFLAFWLFSAPSTHPTVKCLKLFARMSHGQFR